MVVTGEQGDQGQECRRGDREAGLAVETGSHAKRDGTPRFRSHPSSATGWIRSQAAAACRALSVWSSDPSLTPVPKSASGRDPGNNASAAMLGGPVGDSGCSRSWPHRLIHPVRLPTSVA